MPRGGVEVSGIQLASHDRAHLQITPLIIAHRGAKSQRGRGVSKRVIDTRGAQPHRMRLGVRIQNLTDLEKELTKHVRLPDKRVGEVVRWAHDVTAGREKEARIFWRGVCHS